MGAKWFKAELYTVNMLPMFTHWIQAFTYVLLVQAVYKNDMEKTMLSTINTNNSYSECEKQDLNKSKRQKATHPPPPTLLILATISTHKKELVYRDRS